MGNGDACDALELVHDALYDGVGDSVHAGRGFVLDQDLEKESKGCKQDPPASNPHLGPTQQCTRNRKQVALTVR